MKKERLICVKYINYFTFMLRVDFFVLFVWNVVLIIHTQCRRSTHIDDVRIIYADMVCII